MSAIMPEPAMDHDYDEVALVPYVDWGSIIAGAILAAAIFTMMTTFGAAIGLSASSPFAGKGLSATAIAIAGALWALWIAVSSFVAGGYLAGRMRRRAHDASGHESQVRDGVHGLVVWALGAIVIAWLTASAATSVVGGIAKVAAGAGGQVAQTVAQSGVVDTSAFQIDRLMRAPAGAAGTPTGALPREEITRLFSDAATTGAISADDKAWLVSQIVSRTGVTPAEATKRIDDATNGIAAASAKARQAAETARKTGILIAFLSAASLVISAASAWWAAAMGGKHRDDGIDLAHLIEWR